MSAGSGVKRKGQAVKVLILGAPSRFSLHNRGPMHPQVAHLNAVLGGLARRVYAPAPGGEAARLTREPCAAIAAPSPLCRYCVGCGLSAGNLRARRGIMLCVGRKG